MQIMSLIEDMSYMVSTWVVNFIEDMKFMKVKSFMYY
jgi:hypothetical protein